MDMPQNEVLCFFALETLQVAQKIGHLMLRHPHMFWTGPPFLDPGLTTSSTSLTATTSALVHVMGDPG